MTLRRPPLETPALYAQDGKGYDAVVYAHYFIGDSDWLITELDRENDTAFGWACLNGDRLNAELGYVYLPELEDLAVPLEVAGWRGGQLYMVVDYDENWKPVTITEAIAELDRRHGRTE